MAKLLGEEQTLRYVICTLLVINSLTLTTAQQPPDVRDDVDTIIEVPVYLHSQYTQGQRSLGGFLQGAGQVVGGLPIIGSFVKPIENLVAGGLNFVGNIFGLNPDQEKTLCYVELGRLCVPPWDPNWLRIADPFKYELLNPKFTLYTSEQPGGVEIKTHQNYIRNFDASRPLKIFIPGYFGRSGNNYQNQITQLISGLAQKYIRLQNANFVVVTYNAGTTYGEAVSNARVVGLAVGHLLDYLQQNKGLDPYNVHVIGEGVGAHAASYIKLAHVEIGRITGLDPPARGYRQVTSELYKLDKDDAAFVDVIHTDVDTGDSGLGYRNPSGHVDFYPNGGARQPGCPPSPNAFVNDLLENRDASGGGLCNHLRAGTYFLITLGSNDCKFVGRACENSMSFQQGMCTRCSNTQECAVMGEEASKYDYNPSTQISFFFTTGPFDKLCNPNDNNYQDYLQLTGYQG